MSTNRSPIEERLIGQPHPPGSAEEVAAMRLLSAANQKPPGPVALARVQTRLGLSTAPTTTRLRWKTILAVVAISAGVGGATGAAMWVAMPILKGTRSMPATAVSAAQVEPRARVRKGGRLRPPRPGELSPTGSPDELAATAAPLPPEAPGPTFGPEPMPAPEAVTAPVPPLVAARVSRPVAAPVAAVVPGPSSVSRSLSGSSASLLERPIPSPSAHGAKRLALVEPPAALVTSLSDGTQPTPAIAQEAQLLGLALQRLRQDHDPRGALAALDAHAARFPATALGPEADITRVDALLALDRRQPALAVLDRLSLPATTRGRELAVVRAELRAGAKRYAEAIADFTRTLADGGQDTLSERALHGRIACDLATGDEARARADLRDYLARFPTGRFAPGVRRTLGEIEGRRPTP